MLCYAIDSNELSGGGGGGGGGGDTLNHLSLLLCKGMYFLRNIR